MRRIPVAFILVTALGACRREAPPSPSRLVVAYPAGATIRYSYASGDEFNTAILRNAYEPLVDIDRDLSIRPCLAESWHSPDDHTWVFRLRDGVRFHDGRRLTAGHVVEYLRRSIEDPQSRRVTPITALEAPDDRTVVLRTPRPSGMLHTYLNALFIALPPAREGDPPLGTGRYRPRRWDANGTVAMETFADHRDGPAPIRELEFRAAASAEERLRLVETGAAHLAVDVPRSAMAEARPGVRTVSVPGLRVVVLGVNSRPSAVGAPPELRDVRVRAALAHAIDRRRLVAGPLGGMAEVVDEMVPREVFGHHGRLAPREHDPARARQLLAAAGVRPGLAMALDYVPARYRAIDEVARQVAEDLRAAGIVAEPRGTDLAAFRERVSLKRETALFLIGWLSVTGDAMTTLGVLAGGTGTLGMYSGFSEPEVDELLARASGPITLDERKAILHRLAEQLHERVAAVPLYRQHDLYAFAEGLDFTPRLDRRIRGDEIRWRPAFPSP